MSSEPIISLRNVSKTYRAYVHPLHGLLNRLSGGQVGHYKEFHALNGIDLDIYKGETIGVIGRNGSGKSTLLQLICGIRKPTTGSITVNGRIAALLELGSGFHPELTGRENVFLQGAIMGLRRDEMEIKFDEISTFAGIGEYIEQPVKTYSSGMFVRLAFAVAVSIQPDILIIDEALAVGDMAFQKKSFDHISRMIHHHGLTVILVSHELRLIQRFCKRAIYLDQGNCILDGDAISTCQKYYETNSDNHSKDRTPAERYINSTDEIELLSTSILTESGEPITAISSGAPLLVRIRFRLTHKMNKLEFIIGTQSSDLTYLSSSSTTEQHLILDLDAGIHEVEYFIKQFPLAPGRYFIRFNARDEMFRLFFVGDALQEFFVKPDPDGATRPLRLLNLDTSLHINTNCSVIQ